MYQFEQATKHYIKVYINLLYSRKFAIKIPETQTPNKFNDAERNGMKNKTIECKPLWIINRHMLHVKRKHLIFMIFFNDSTWMYWGTKQQYIQSQEQFSVHMNQKRISGIKKFKVFRIRSIFFGHVCIIFDASKCLKRVKFTPTQWTRFKLMVLVLRIFSRVSTMRTVAILMVKIEWSGCKSNSTLSTNVIALHVFACIRVNPK